jgi:heterodisulfide reductase subunit C
METELTIPAHSSLADEVYSECGENVNLCYQCRKCSAGCPVSYAMDYPPAQLMHAIRLGLDDLVYNSKTMWMCASCETCSTRCPQEIEIATVMDAVKIIGLRKGKKPAVPRVSIFDKVMVNHIKSFGRMFELGMIMNLKLKTREFLKDAELGIGLLRKGKLKMVPRFTGAMTARKIYGRVKKLEKRGRREAV